MTVTESARRLAEMPGLLRETRSVFRAMANDVESLMPEGSVRKEDSESGVEGPAGTWDDQPIQITVKAALLYSAAAAEHLGNMGVLVEAGERSLSLEVLARSVMELAMRASWILDASVGVEERGARATLDTLDSIRRIRPAYSRLEGKKGPTSVQLRKLEKHLREDVVPAFFGEAMLDLDKPSAEWVLGGQRLPSPTIAAEAFGEFVGLGERTGAGMYDYLSAYVHPNLMELILRVNRGALESPELGISFEHQPEHFDGLISAALAAFYRAFRLIASYHSWDKASFDAWEAAYFEVFPGASD